MDFTAQIEIEKVRHLSGKMNFKTIKKPRKRVEYGSAINIFTTGNQNFNLSHASNRDTNVLEQNTYRPTRSETTEFSSKN